MAVLAYVSPTSQCAAEQLRIAANHAEAAARIVEQVMSVSRSAATVMQEILPEGVELTAAYGLRTVAEILECETDAQIMRSRR